MEIVPSPVTGLLLSEHLQMPPPSRVNRLAVAHETWCERNADELGLLRTAADLKRLQAFVKINCFVFPHATLERLNAVGSFTQWLYFLDDSYDDDPKVARDLAGVRRVMERAMRVLQSGTLPRAPTPFEKLSQQVHQRLTAVAPRGWMTRFLSNVHDYLFNGSLAAMSLWRRGVVPDVVEYMRVRMADSGVRPCLNCTELSVEAELPARVLEHPLIRKAERHTVRHVAFTNDLFSYQKEVLKAGSPFNLTYVVGRDRGMQLQQSVQRVSTIINAELAGFHAAEAAMPSFGTSLDRQRSDYFEGLLAWMRGNIEFSLQSARFAAPDSPFVELRRTRTSTRDLPAITN